jgi:hypothetical protein
VVCIFLGLTAIGFVDVVTRATRSLPFIARASSWAQGYWLGRPGEQPIIAIELCSLVLAILGLFVGYKAIRLARDHDRDLLEVGKSIQTRFIGKFPQHLSRISDLINAAEAGQFLDILSDCSDYGSFFAPSLHEKVHDAIISAWERGVQIRYLASGPLHHVTQNSPFYTFKFSDLMGDDDKAALGALKTDFRWHLGKFLEHLRDKNFAGWLNSIDASELRTWVAAAELKEPPEADQLASRIKACEAVCRSANGVFEKNQEHEYHTLLWCREKYFEDKLRAKLGKNFWRESNRKSDTPLLFWVNRDREAIFMPVFEAERTRGLGFRTQDNDLLDVFQGTFDARWRPHADSGPLLGKPERPFWQILPHSFSRLRLLFKR